MTTTNNSIWMRLGIFLHGSPEEIGNILNGDQFLLEKLLREGKFVIYGDTYFLGTIIEEYNQMNGTHYQEQDTGFDIISFKQESDGVAILTGNYKTCPCCEEDALKYAVIDMDGTNLEDGYSCTECGANFIGIDNEQVIEFNPEITTDDE